MFQNSLSVYTRGYVWVFLVGIFSTVCLTSVSPHQLLPSSWVFVLFLSIYISIYLSLAFSLSLSCFLSTSLPPRFTSTPVFLWTLSASNCVCLHHFFVSLLSVCINQSVSLSYGCLHHLECMFEFTLRQFQRIFQLCLQRLECMIEFCLSVQTRVNLHLLECISWFLSTCLLSSVYFRFVCQHQLECMCEFSLHQLKCICKFYLHHLECMLQFFHLSLSLSLSLYIYIYQSLIFFLSISFSFSLSLSLYIYIYIYISLH